MLMDKQEIVKTAIRLEEDGVKFYLDVAKRSKNEMVQSMFKSLAEEELRHIKWIQENFPGADQAKQFNEDLYSNLKKVFTDIPASLKDEATGTGDDIKAVKIAIDMENKSAQIYSEWVNKSDDETIKDMFKALAETEKGHRKLLENTLEFLQHPEDWYMQEERWSFDGG